MFGQDDVFPEDTVKTTGLYRGITRTIYIAADIPFYEKFYMTAQGIVYSISVILLVLAIIVVYLGRNKITCQKFKCFRMKYSNKMLYIPETFSNMKNKGIVIGETTYKIADLPLYRE